MSLVQEDFFRLDHEPDIEKRIFRGLDVQRFGQLCVTHVAIYKTPLDGIYRSSPSKMRDSFRKQWTSVDYHAFVVMKTNCGVCVSLEKQRDGIYVGKSTCYEYMVWGMQSSPRPLPVELVIEDSSTFTLYNLLGILKNECRDYSATNDNCQHFAKRIFDKISSKKSWQYAGPKEYLYEKLIILIFCLITFDWMYGLHPLLLVLLTDFKLSYLVCLACSAFLSVCHFLYTTCYYICYMIYSACYYLFYSLYTACFYIGSFLFSLVFCVCNYIFCYIPYCVLCAAGEAIYILSVKAFILLFVIAIILFVMKR